MHLPHPERGRNSVSWVSCLHIKKLGFRSRSVDEMSCVFRRVDGGLSGTPRWKPWFLIIEPLKMYGKLAAAYANRALVLLPFRKHKFDG
ncbi:MAG: hypothetical protein CBE00_05535 [Planctomycetaceae bacterium TMED240]|nr:hypothetical protein [Rhodopirellula sp.]OUX07208.1 MAG: hypothetical protein CBE00_05535 [Planctomycetaceae bacterium TMED240]